MKKFFPVVLGLLMPLAGAMADTFVDEAVSFCRSKGGAYSMGDMTARGEEYCRRVTCSRTTSDRLEIPAGAPGPEANVEAVKEVCVPKSTIDGNFEPGRNSSTGGNPGGAAGGNPAGAGGAGGAAGGNPAGAGGAGGAAGGNPAGANGGADVIICEELEGEGRLFPGDPCYRECKPRRAILGIVGPRREGLERKSCVDCLRRYPDRYTLRGEAARRGGVTLGGGVGVRTGQIRCRNARTGEIVTVYGQNGQTAVCPSGTVIVTGNVGGTGTIGGTLAAGGNGGIIVVGGTGSVGGNVGAGNNQRPAFCNSSRRSDIEACEAWIRNNARFNCSIGGNCPIDSGSIYSRYDENCVNCGPGSRRQSTLSGIAEIAGAIAPPLAALGIGYFQSRAQIRSNEAWAGAAAVGFEQCQIAQNNYLQYLAGNELPGLTPEQQRAMNCNGYGLGQFAGMGGQFGGLMGAGYSPGFIGGMMGPYGGYNPYGGMGGMMGGVMGGVMGGMAGGMYPAGGMMAGGMMAGGMYPAGGLAGGGLVNGISLAGGVAAGMYNGGMMAGGMYPAGGMMAGGYMAGGMYPAGGMSGGYMAGGMYPAGGMMYPAGGGLAQGGYLAGGIGVAAGMSGGYLAAGAGGGLSGGYMNCGFTGGLCQGGAGGWGSGVGTGYPYPGAGGGYWGGAGGWGGNSGYLSQQTANYDAMLQQRGLAYNMGQMSSGGYGGYGTAAYSPMNMGGMLGGGFYAGGNIGGGFGF